MQSSRSWLSWWRRLLDTFGCVVLWLLTDEIITILRVSILREMSTCSLATILAVTKFIMLKVGSGIVLFVKIAHYFQPCIRIN